MEYTLLAYVYSCFETRRKNFIDSKMFVERFRLNQMDAYKQHDLEKTSEVSMNKRSTEGEGAMTTTAKINSHIFKIESLCHQFRLQV